jgi:hypothetical protein
LTGPIGNQQRTSHDPNPQQHTDNANWNTPQIPTSPLTDEQVLDVLHRFSLQQTNNNTDIDNDDNIKKRDVTVATLKTSIRA